MTREDIIRMARDAGLSITPARSGEYHGGMVGGDAISLSRFAALVAAAEREACAQLVTGYTKETANMEARGCLVSVAHDIRARGQA